VLRPTIVAVCLLFVPSAVTGQTTATVNGTVQDVGGGAMPGVTVSVTNAATGLTRTNVTAAEGRFVVAGLPPGDYELRAEISGFKPLLRRLTLAVADTVTLNIVLEMAGLQETVTVAEGTPVVNTSSSELSYLVGASTIEALPLNGRNYTDLALLQPGVLAYPHRDGGSVVAHGLGMSVNGQDPRANVYLLDGTLQNDFTNGPAGSAAGTALGMESVREFRVETNAYGAEFGRIAGGQVNVLTKSGGNRYTGSAYEYHRNDALDAANYFDTLGKPDFSRNQFGGTLGGPLVPNRLFFFGGYESLIERLGKTISTVVPDDNARMGILPTGTVGVNPAVAPYLAEYPRANGPSLGQGLAVFDFPFAQRLDEQFIQGRIDYQDGRGKRQMFGRYTFDNTKQFLPTDYPQFPREFLSRNQFFTGEYRDVLSENTIYTARLSFSRTRIGQNVEANTAQPLGPFVPGRGLMGDIDIGGLKRFGPQSSGNLRLVQNVFAFADDLVYSRGAHLVKAGGLIEHYQDNMVNPTFSLGIYSFPNLSAFLRNVPNNFIGLTPDAQFDRYWRFTLFAFYVQDEFRVTPRLTLNGGLRYEFTTMPEDIYGRDSSLPDLSASQPTIGPLYENPTFTNFSPRTGFAWDAFGDGKTAVRGGYGLYFNTTNQQNLIVTVTNPPATPRPVIVNPSFPTPDFNRAGAISMRPVQFDLDNPRVHVFNVNVQRELPFQTALTIGYAGSRGVHLLRSGDVNTALPIVQSDGTVFIPAGTPRQNTSFSTIELKSSDGESWYNALIVDIRRRLTNGLLLQSSYTLSKSEDTTQASTFFSDATNGTTSAMPEYIAGYNKGPSDFDTRHNWMLSFSWEVPLGEDAGPLARALVANWQVSGIWTMRSGQPLTVFVTSNRSRSQWNPSRGPGIGQDRASYAPGFDGDSAINGRPEQWFNPAAVVLQPAGTFGNTGRGDFVGPDLRTLDIAFNKTVPLAALGERTMLDVRVEIFNVLNRPNFGIPELRAFAGQTDGEAPLATFGRISSTVTSSRQTQLSVRLSF
jgi:Carboxypeptidase regulatory-like domain/TonB dependent receptor